MKTLVIQLARFGDIYQTWPSLRALSEKEGSQVHLLVRDSFKAATLGLDSKIRVHTLDSKEFLEPIIHNEGEEKALERLNSFLETLDKESFDQVINLSFSPFSSEMTSHFEARGISVLGYTRHRDGHLNIQGDASAYFYAQVGVHRPNQIHLVDIFAMVCGVDLTDNHKHGFVKVSSEFKTPSARFAVLHVGASDRGKSMSPLQLSHLVNLFLETQDLDLFLIGTQSERDLSQKAVPLLGSERVFDFTGQTSLPDLFELIRKAEFLMGCDSAPIHIASLLDVPVLNFNNKSVNSFETGPFSRTKSFISIDEVTELDSEKFSGTLQKLIHGESGFLNSSSTFVQSQWEMIQSIYMGERYPTKILQMTAVHLSELLEQIPKVYVASERPEDEVNQGIIRQFDRFLERAEAQDEVLGVLIRWFNTERVRIPPGELSLVKAATLQKLNDFYMILTDWARVLGEGMELIDDPSFIEMDLNSVIKNFRFFNLPAAMDDLERLLPQISFLSSTEVLSQEIQSALRIPDYSRLADLLEYKLKPQIQDVHSVLL